VCFIVASDGIRRDGALRRSAPQRSPYRIDLILHRFFPLPLPKTKQPPRDARGG